MADASMEMPKYKCHKEVWALKIAAIDKHVDGTATLHFENARFAPMDVDNDYLTRHLPQAGGYYVQYDTAYASWSPAKAFEDGYTLLP